MKKNMGTADKVIRIVFAIIFVILYFAGIVTGTWGIIMLAVAAIFLITSILGICPLYMPFRISTMKTKV